MINLFLKGNTISKRSRLELVSLFLMFGLLISLGIGISSNMYSKSIDNQFMNIRYSVNNASENLTQIFKGADNVSIALGSTDSISNWLYNPDYYHEDNDKYIMNKNMLEKEFRNYLSFNSVLPSSQYDCITIYMNDTLLTHIYTKTVPIGPIISETEYAYKQISKRENSYIQDVPPKENNKFMFHTRTLKNSINEEERLTIIMALNENKISQKYKNIYNSKGYIAYIVDKDNLIYSSNQRDQLGQKIHESISQISYDQIESIKYQGKKYDGIKKDINDGQFSLIYLVPRSETFNDAMNRMSWIIIVAIIIFFTVFIVSTVYTIKSSTFIEHLASAMNEVKNENYDVIIPSQHDKALDQLGTAFNDMTKELKNLIQKTYRSELLMKEMEIKHLQHQINPHFLFNILLTIQLKTSMSGDKVVYKMIESLSKLLRAGIYGNKSLLITVDEEISYIEFYLYLQKQRFEDKLEYKINMEKSLLDYQIPRLTLEPIVENAVVHGVEHKEETVHITINGREQDGYLEFDIMDNGQGFDVDEFRSKHEKNHANTKGHREQIGLKNTDDRLKLIYGDGYGIQINSQVGVGTHVKITIPVENSQ